MKKKKSLIWRNKNQYKRRNGSEEKSLDNITINNITIDYIGRQKLRYVFRNFTHNYESE